MFSNAADRVCCRQGEDVRLLISIALYLFIIVNTQIHEIQECILLFNYNYYQQLLSNNINNIILRVQPIIH